MLRLLIISILSFLISIIIGKFLYKSKLPISLIDKPEPRKIHTTPTPLVGGIAIIFSLLIVTILFNLYNDSAVQIYIIFSLYFFFVGLFDDLFQWDYKRKFLLQIVGTIAFSITIAQNIETLYFSSISSSNLVINYILIFLWILFIINAFNFFDGVNFLAGSLAIVFFSSFILYFRSAGDIFAVSILLILIFSVLGFLIYNRAPAKMFLGDAGSMFLGFTMAAFPLIFSTSNTQVYLTYFVVVVFILISDTIFVLITRFIRNKNPFRPDKTHLHHQLLNLKFRNRYVVLIISIGALIHTILAVYSNSISLIILIILLNTINFVFIILPRFLPQAVDKYNLWGMKKRFDKTVNYFQDKKK